MAEFFLVTLIIIALCLIIGCMFALVRNEWVYRQRIFVLRSENGLEEFKRLPSYDEMMGRFWVWDVEKFKSTQAAENE